MIPTDDEDQESRFQVDVGNTHETTEIPDNNNNGDVISDDGNDELTPNANYYLWL